MTRTMCASSSMSSERGGASQRHLRWLWLPAWLLLTASSTYRCSNSDSVLIRDDDFFNQAPVAFDDDLLATVDEPLTDAMRATDADGDVLVFSIVETPSLGTVTVDDTRTGAFTYVASAEGSDAFSFVVSDGQASSNRATITIVVNADTVQLTERDTGKPAARCGAPTTPRLAVDPFDPSHRLRFEGSTLQRSLDAGSTWADAWPGQNGPRPDDARLSFSHDLPGLIYVGLTGEAGRSALYRSGDGGWSWQLIAQLDGSLAEVRSTRGTLPDQTTVAVALCGRTGELAAVDHPWR